MKKAKKHENDEFLLITLKHVSVLEVVGNFPRTPKQWAIAHQNGHKTRKRRFSCYFSQTCKGYYGPCKLPWNPQKVSNISLNGHKTRNRRVVAHNPNTCIGP